MLAHIADLANLVTLGGLALAFFACWAVLSGRPSLALALAALAVVIDNMDGWIARRTVGRNSEFEYFGAHLDCYSDFICKGIFPALYLLSATDLQLVSIPAALIYLMAIAVRYSYEFVPDRAHIGMDLYDPDPDFAAMAKSMGWYAEGPILDGDDVQPALKRAIEQVKAGKPALVDTVCQRGKLSPLT